MPELRGLPGTLGVLEAEIVRSVSGAVKALRAGKAATAAGPNGAINVWCDDAGVYRCEAMRLYRTLEATTFRAQKDICPWVRKWLAKINEEMA